MTLNEATTHYDAEFGKVHGLTWLPWVGQRFSERLPHHRLLVVGESHYFRGNTPEERQIDREGYKDSRSTRIMVAERGWGAKTWNTLPRLLFKTTDVDLSKFWADAAYYNFIQRPMDYNQEGQPERPSPDNFAEGWKVFAEVVRILQPSQCLFIGVAAANSFNLGSISYSQQVGRTWARVAKLELAGNTIELIFVQHLGKYFSWSQWHDYLQFQHANFMSWLGAESYVINHNAQSITEPAPVLT